MYEVWIKAVLVATLWLRVLMTNLSLVAQTNSTITDIPFDFEGGSNKLHAGRYRMWTSPTSTSLRAIARIDQKCNLVALVNSVDSWDSHVLPKLVFYKYGDRYVLHEMWSAGSLTGREIQQKSKSGTSQRQAFQKVVLFGSQR